jgi:hypothetical protein
MNSRPEEEATTTETKALIRLIDAGWEIHEGLDANCTPRCGLSDKEWGIVLQEHHEALIEAEKVVYVSCPIHGQPEVSSERIHEIIKENREVLDMLGEADHGQPEKKPSPSDYMNCDLCSDQYRALLSLAERMREALKQTRIQIQYTYGEGSTAHMIDAVLAEFDAWEKEK